MSYLGDIRENSFGPNGELWEGDNRIEERHYWNGAFIDLCNLSAEDYAKTIFVTNGSESSDTPTKQNNPITVQETEYMNESGEIFFAYKAVAKQPVTSEVTIEMSVTKEDNTTEKITIKIPVGANESDVVPTSTYKIEGVERPMVNTSNYSPKEDETFKYNTILPEKPIILPMAYSITMLSGKIDTISDDELVEKLIASGKIAMKDATTSERFTVDFTPIPVDGLETMGVIELTDALINNASDIILVTDKTIKSIEQADVAGINELPLWVKREGNVQIEGKSFNVWYKRDEGQTSQSRICDSVNTEYVVGADPRDYIIYYE